MTWSRNEPFQREKPVIAFVDGIQTPYSVLLSNKRFPYDNRGRKTSPSGIFVCRMGTEVHPLPRSTVVSAFTTTSNTAVVSLPAFFLPGDQLQVVEPYTISTISGAYPVGSTITCNIGNFTSVTLTFDITNATTASTAAASTLASFINSNANLSQRIFAIADGSLVYTFSKQGLENVPTNFVVTGGGAIASSTTAELIAVIGTVVSVALDGTVLLTGNAAVNVPVGAHIGVPVDEIYGVYPHAMDVTNRVSSPIAPVAGAHGVFEGALPYIDGDIKRRLSRIRFAFKF